MNKKLFWKLLATLAIFSISMVLLISKAGRYIELQMTSIADENKAIILAYRDQAEHLLQQGDWDAAATWIEQVQGTENTYASIMRLQPTELPHIDRETPREIKGKYGRRLHWHVHLDDPNPLLDLPLSDGKTSFLFELPDHMTPGRWWPLVNILLHLVIPLFLLALVSIALYHHLMKPLHQLEKATHKFAEGELDTRLLPKLKGRNDEIASIAQTFDLMASKVSALIEAQRNLISDLSHELRTPLQRIELSIPSDDSLTAERLQRETGLMRKLVEDTLTLAWLENEAPELNSDTLDLVALLEAITDDAQFEFSDRCIQLNIPDECILPQVGERALSIAVENIIRNALRYTPPEGDVVINLQQNSGYWQLSIQDSGPGVPEEMLELIFKPFFRVDKSRGRQAGGFGLGLALAKRQIESMGANIRANNLASGGLNMQISFPLSGALQA